MAAGSAVIRYIQEHDLARHSELVGQHLRERLQELQRVHPQLGDVRGRGLMLGVEIVDPAGVPDTLGHPPYNPALASAIQRECLKRGLILELGGRHGSVVRFLPPLIITHEEVEQVAGIFARAVSVALAAC